MEATNEATRGQEHLTQILRLMGFEAEVSVVDGADKVTLEVRGPEVGQLIGRRGATIDALQLLVAKMVTRGAESEKPIIVDIAGYRDQRNNELLDMAKRAVEQAVRTGRAVALEPMSAHDRRVIHVALAENAAVTTQSEGDGPSRRLTVVPAAPAAAPAAR